MDELKLKWSNCDRTEFLDFVVSGQSLFETLRALGYQLAGCLGWVGQGFSAMQRERLLLKRAPDLASGRVALYICPECGDYGCGVVSARVMTDEQSFIWSDFVFEVDDNLNAQGSRFEPYSAGYYSQTRMNRGVSETQILTPAIGPFHFDASDYRSELSTVPPKA